jgi:Fe-S cluster assembly scaffold protein SufB
MELGIDNPYVDRMREKLNAIAWSHNIEQEILAEQAASLGATEQKLCRAMLEMAVASKEAEIAIEKGRESVTAREAVARFNAAREHAFERREYLIIQREALGMRRDNDVVRSMYPIPPVMRVR